MDQNTMENQCLNCVNSEMVAPLISLRYAGEHIWICSPCMPILIHNPQRMIGALKGADKIPPTPHKH